MLGVIGVLGRGALGDEAGGMGMGTKNNMHLQLGAHPRPPSPPIYMGGSSCSPHAAEPLSASGLPMSEGEYTSKNKRNFCPLGVYDMQFTMP